MIRSVDRFVRDERALSGFQWLQIAILLLIPIAAFVFWFQYLRRLHRDEDAKYGAWGAPPKSQGATAAPEGRKRQCGKCGLWVNPPRGSGPPTCPNCMSVL